MTSSRSGGAHRDGSQPGERGTQDRAGVGEQATDTGARPDLDEDEPDSPTELSKPLPVRGAQAGPHGVQQRPIAYGVDMTDEMLALARANATKAGATNVEFRKGITESIPLPDAAVDVMISNCVINLSTDKPAVLAEMFRVLAPGGRVGVSDVVAEDHLTPADRAERGSYVGCITGALTRAEYLDGLTAAGFVVAEVVFTHEAAPGMHGAIVRATKPTA